MVHWSTKPGPSRRIEDRPASSKDSNRIIHVVPFRENDVFRKGPLGCRGVMTDGGPGSARLAEMTSSSASPRSARARSRAVPCCPTTRAGSGLRRVWLPGSVRIRSAGGSTSQSETTRSRAPGSACSRHPSIKRPSAGRITDRSGERRRTDVVIWLPRLILMSAGSSTCKSICLGQASKSPANNFGPGWRDVSSSAQFAASSRQARETCISTTIMKQAACETGSAGTATSDLEVFKMIRFYSARQRTTSIVTGQWWGR